MRKITLLIALLSIVFSISAEVTIQTAWEFSNAKGNMHAGWDSRKIAVGDLGKGERVYALKGRNVLIYDAENGTSVGTLPGTLTNYALLAVGDIGVTDDGKLLVSNVSAHNADNSPFQVYLWADEDSNPVKVIEHKFNKQRFGDNIFVEGNYDVGTAKVYATRKIDYSTAYKVLCWSMEEDTENAGTYVFKNTPSETIEVIGAAIQWAGVCTIPGGGFYFKDGGNNSDASASRLQQFDADFDPIGTANPGIVSRHSDNPRFALKDGDDHYVTLFNYNTAANAGEDRAELFLIPDGDIDNIESVIYTPSLGVTANANGWGAIVAKTEEVDDKTLIVLYVSSALNGIGKYVIDLDGQVDDDDDDDEAAVKTEWEYSRSKGNIPTGWSYRKIAVGDMGQGERVYAAKGTGSVLVYNAENGQYVRDLTGTIPKTALLAIGDLGMTEDNKLLVSNVSAHNVDNSPFQVYMWVDEDTAPTKVIDSKFNKERFGDNISVEGNYDEGTAKVYATRKTTSSTIACWSMIEDNENPGKYVFNNTPEIVAELAAGSLLWPGITNIPEGGYYFKDGGDITGPAATRLQQYDATFTLTGDANPGIVHKYTTSPKFVTTHKDDHYVLLYRYYQTSGITPAGLEESRAELFKITNGDMAEIKSVALTPALGNNSDFNGWGSVTGKVDGDDMVIYVSSATNGFGKYRIKDLFLVTDVQAEQTNATVTIAQQQGMLTIMGVEQAEVDIYNLMGQQVLHHVGTTISTSHLRGIHLINVKVAGKSVKTAKLIF